LQEHFGNALLDLEVGVGSEKVGDGRESEHEQLLEPGLLLVRRNGLEQVFLRYEADHHVEEACRVRGYLLCTRPDSALMYDANSDMMNVKSLTAFVIAMLS
jgi:hypothetical protein